MKPDRIEFKLGETIHGAPIKLVYQKDYMGVYSWELIKEPANQRDDRDSINGIKTESLQKISEALKLIG